MPHVTRVLFWSADLTPRVGRIDGLGWRELFWAAAVHDVARVDDGIDPGHGERAAPWVTQGLVGERPATASFDLDFVAELCHWRQVADQAIPPWSLDLMILKDADGLDRCRIQVMDRVRLRLRASLRLVEAAQRHEAATSAYGSRAAAETLGRAEAMLPHWFPGVG